MKEILILKEFINKSQFQMISVHILIINPKKAMARMDF